VTVADSRAPAIYNRCLSVMGFARAHERGMPSRACPCVRACCIRFQELLASGGVVGQPTRILLAGGHDSPILRPPPVLTSSSGAVHTRPRHTFIAVPFRSTVPLAPLSLRRRSRPYLDESHALLYAPAGTHTHTRRHAHRLRWTAKSLAERDPPAPCSGA